MSTALHRFEPGTRVTFPVHRGPGPVTYAKGVVVERPSYAISYCMVRVENGSEDQPVIEVRCDDLLPEGEHVGYPHEPGRLCDCPACETSCHCGPGVARGEGTECIWSGHEAEED